MEILVSALLLVVASLLPYYIWMAKQYKKLAEFYRQSNKEIILIASEANNNCFRLLRGEMLRIEECVKQMEQLKDELNALKQQASSNKE